MPQKILLALTLTLEVQSWAWKLCLYWLVSSSGSPLSHAAGARPLKQQQLLFQMPLDLLRVQ